MNTGISVQVVLFLAVFPKLKTIQIQALVQQQNIIRRRPPPLGIQPLRVHSNKYDYVNNSTSAAIAYRKEKCVDVDEELQAQQFMEDALSELESFQLRNSNGRDDTASTVVSSVYNSASSSSSENYLSNINHEVSLLFPPAIGEIDVGNNASIISNGDGSAAVLSTLAQKDSTSNALLLIGNDNDKIENFNDVDYDGVWRARFLLVAAAALYGTNFSIVKLLGDEMPVGISTPIRFGLAALATLPWLLDGFIPNISAEGSTSAAKNQLAASSNGVSTTDFSSTSPHVLATLWGLEVGLWNSVGYVAQAVGLETTLASESAFLCSMAVVIVPLLDWIAGKKLMPRQWGGALIALVGVAFLELGGGGSCGDCSSAGLDGTALMMSSTNNGIATGDALSLVQPFAFGVGFWRMEQAMDRFPEEAPRLTAAQLMVVFMSSVAYGLWTIGLFNSDAVGCGSESSLSTIATTFPWKEWFADPSILFSLFWTGCITTALTIYMETLALKNLSAAETTLIFSTEPLWGTAFAVAVMGEQMGMNAVFGAGLILTACIYSNLGMRGLWDMWNEGLGWIMKNNDEPRP